MEIEKTNKKGLIITLAIIIVLIIAGLGVYSLVLNKPKNIFLKNINKGYEKFNSILVYNDIKSLSTSLDFDFNINLNESVKKELSDEDIKILDEINSLNYKIEMSADKENKLFNLLMDIKSDKNSLFNVGAYGKPNSVYLDLKDLYDKYIEIPVEEYSTYFEDSSINFEDLKYMMDKLKDSIIKNLDENDFVKTNEKTNIDGKEINVTKITYALTKYKLTNISINVLKEIKEDSTFVDKLSKLASVTSDEIKKEIDEMINELNENLEKADKTKEVLISMYTKGIMNDAVKYSIKSDDSELIYTNYDNKKSIIVKDNETTYLTITNIKTSENIYKTELTMDTVKITVDSNKEKNTWTHNYKLLESESTMDISGTYTYKMEEVNKDEYNEDVKLTMSINVNATEMINMDITAKGNTKYNATITLPELSNKVLYTQLTEEDTNEILLNLMNNETLVNFMNIISELSIQDDYEEDYDFDYENDFEEEL